MSKLQMNRRKKISALTLVFFFFGILFTACSPGKKNDKVTTIDIFQFKVEIVDALQDIIALYEKENPDVKINLETVGGGDDYEAALRAKMQGDEPTIFNVGGPQALQIWKNKVDDLSLEPWVPHAAKGVLDGVTMDGKVYGLPFNVEGYGFIYNKDIFKDAGIDMSQVEGFDSLKAALTQLKQKIDSGALKEKYPHLEAVFSFPAKEKWVGGQHTLNVILANDYKSSLDTFKAKTLRIRYADPYKLLIDLEADFSPYAQNKERLNAVDYATQIGGGLAIERVAMVQQGNWIYGEVMNVDKNVMDKLAMIPIPVKGGIEDSIPVGVPQYWAVNKDVSEAKRKAAKKFLNWLYQSDEGKKLVVEKLLFIPPFTNYEGLSPADPLGKTIKKYVDEGKILPWVFSGFPPGAGTESTGAYIQEYLSGKISWDGVIEKTKKQWEEARK